MLKLTSTPSSSHFFIFVILDFMISNLLKGGSNAVMHETTNHSKIQCYFVKMLLKTIIYIPYISCISQLIAQASIYLVFLRYQRCISNSQSKKIYDWIYHCLRLNSPAVLATTTEKLHSLRAFCWGESAIRKGQRRPHKQGQDQWC